ncbi:LysR family transcriptional regulator [Vibrio sp. SS-MA-C1-2]|uniref:LysR family transcriptional regulator n=1 Tax=Vibrio sp. SS-MA-C1-2 TaxID=2908646 RepID=UPI001F3F915C|nr:LysR family transcriptional regulator [Vibrio sp. SS-MA-C1-2]UJF18350.1 LysR family transcriptional regulator [Vibrio sp. SS-MA-C1-2]
MRLDDIRVFHTVVEAGGFTAAAHVLDLPKSNISRRVSQLEANLNVTLFQRTTRKLFLTDKGKTYYERTRILMNEFVELNENMMDRGQDIKANIRLQIFNEAIMFMSCFYKFQQRYPNIHLNITAHNQQVLLEQHSFDLSMRVGIQPDSSMVARSLGEFKRIIVASPTYIANYGHPETIEQISDHNSLCFRTPDGIIEKEWIIGPERIPVEIKSKIICNSALIVHHAACSGEGISYLPEELCEEDIASGRLINLFPNIASHPEKVWLVFPSRQRLSYASRLLLEFLIEELKSDK